MSKIKDIYGLVPLQQGILFHSIYNKDTGIYLNQLTANLYGDVNLQIFQECWNELLLRHDILRSSFHWKELESPVQAVHGPLKIPWANEDWRDMSPDDQYQKFESFIKADRAKGFDLEKPPLVRIFIVKLDDKKYRFCLSHHHIVMDGWSRSNLFKELFYRYEHAINKTPVSLDPITPFKKFVEKMTGPGSNDTETYWRDQLRGYRSSTPIPAAITNPKKLLAGKNMKEKELIIGKEESLFIRSTASKYNITLNTVFQGVWAILLSSYAGEDEVIFGTTVSGRNMDLKGIQSMVGVFINSLPVTVKINKEMGLLSWLQYIQDNQINREPHAQTPLSDIQKWSEFPSGSSLFESILVFENYPIGFSLEENETNIKVDDVKFFEQTNFPLTVIIIPGNEIYIKFLYDSFYFDEVRFNIFLKHVEELLTRILHDPYRSVGNISFISRDEQKLILENWNDTGTKFEDHRTIPELFNSIAVMQPAAPALWFKGNGMNYGELNSRVNQLSHYLLKKGLKKGEIIGVCLERSLEMVISLMGILKAGGIYLPMEPTDPIKRLDFIIKDASPAYIISQVKWKQSVPDSNIQVIFLDTISQEISKEKVSHPGISIGLDHPIYLMYTSGSTGQPKGVLLPHRGVLNTILWLKNLFVRDGDNRFLQNTPFTFDISVWEIFLPLISGFELIIAKPGGHMDSAYMVHLIRKKEITILQLVPSMLRAILEDPDSGSITSLKEVICCGEVLPADIKNKFYTLFNCRLSNLYGPTEASIFASCYHCEKSPQTGGIPIGKPVSNTKIYILDKLLRPTPIGITGDLYISGEGLAIRYHNREELTNERFVPNPFDANGGSRMYKSGDLARFLPNGDIEFLGRNDFQLKIQGHRIETGEIEVLLGRHPEVKETVVVPMQLAEGEKKLLAYFVSKHNKLIPVNDLRVFLEKELPGYMIPTHFIPIPAIPLGINGKLDRNALPLPGFSRPDLEDSYVEPRNPLEQQLATIWKEILEIEKIGVHDNFFQLGGASFSSIRVVNSALKTGIVINPEQVFRYPTIAKLAAVIENESIHVPDAQPVTPGKESFLSPVAEVAVTFKDQKDSTIPINNTSVTGNVLIESLGMYLPVKSVTTEEVMDKCVNPVKFPLKELTGIETRRMVSDNEFAIDLAKKAMEDCFSRSKYQPEEIELLICTNISRFDKQSQFSYEPSTSMQLKSHFRLKNAMVFDTSNACPTTFTGLNIIEAMFRSGVIKTAMVVSGEFITHLTATAQKEIENFMDLRMACLTVGDSGIAMILERSENKAIGFHEIDMFTLGSYWTHCIGKLSNEVHGGPIMFNDSIKSAQALDIQKIAESALRVAARNGHSPTDFDYIVFHNTSKTTQGNAIKEINKMFNKELVNEDNYLSSLAEYGNTASTSHFVTIMLNIQNGKINKGDKIIFGITGSGITLGTAIYTFDDLPEKILNKSHNKIKREELPDRQRTIPASSPNDVRVQVAGIGTSIFSGEEEKNAISMLLEASRICIEDSGINKNDLGMIIHSGIYRDDFISEPAIAAIIAGELDINAIKTRSNSGQTLAFDIINGGLGTLNACYVAIQMIRANKAVNVMVATSEVENNLKLRPDHLMRIQESGAAIILSPGSQDRKGFGRFVFKYKDKYIGAMNSFATWKDGKNYLSFSRHPHLEKHYIEVIKDAVNEICTLEDISVNDFDLIIPPQISGHFIDQLIAELGFRKEKVVDITQGGKNWLTASLPQSLNLSIKNKWVKAGDRILIIEVGSGVQAGCAIYYY